METIKNNALVEAFQFSATKQELRSLVINQEPWVVAKDVCEILAHSNHKVAVRALDDDEVRKVYLTDSLGRKQQTHIINESGLYALIMRSNKPEAKTFRKWVTSEVLPAIRKKGYYGTKPNQKQDYIDARATVYNIREYNGIGVRYINIDGTLWFSINDIHKAIGARTASSQAVKKLNAVETLAQKIFLFGNTHPSWFTNEKGLQLLLVGSRVLNANRQMALNFGGGEQC